jgi:hypothetical protein
MAEWTVLLPPRRRARRTWRATPDRLKWNARYRHLFAARFTPHPLAAAALALLPPTARCWTWPAACPASAAAAAAGREVIAVDASEVALTMLAKEAAAGAWRPGHAGPGRPARVAARAGGYALVLGTGYWDRGLFPDAPRRRSRRAGLLPGRRSPSRARKSRPGLEPGRCLDLGEPAALLPAGSCWLTGRGHRVRPYGRWPRP